jgi:hypothetical protein
VIPANRQRNFLQSALYVAIFAVLAALLLERLLTYAEVAEKAAMEGTLASVRAGLYSQVALLSLRGDRAAVEALPAQNPFVTSDVRSPNYLGEVYGTPAAGVKGGSWFYDRSRREIIYVPNLHRYFTPAAGEEWLPAARFQVELQRAPGGGYTGVVLQPVGEFRWAPSP